MILNCQNTEVDHVKQIIMDSGASVLNLNLTSTVLYPNELQQLTKLFCVSVSSFVNGNSSHIILMSGKNEWLNDVNTLNTSVSYSLSLREKTSIGSIIVKSLRFNFYNNHRIGVKIFYNIHSTKSYSTEHGSG